MATEMSFTEWLQKKAEESNQPERIRRRGEWLATLRHLYEQIMCWLRESDPQGLLIVEWMELERTEPSLGTYTAPALKISLGNAAVRVVPMGRGSRGSFRDQEGAEGQYEGRVDITDGVRKYVIFHAVDKDQGKWIVLGEGGAVQRFDRAQLEAILRDLWS